MLKKDILKSESPKSMYVHVPFCQSICAYCDFTRVAYQEKTVSKWLIQIKKDLADVANKELTTIYLGGGTPSCLNIHQLEELLIALEGFDVAMEYTIEVNPETLTTDKAKLLVEHGVNRVSLGVQSFQDILLETINRKHRKKDIIRCVALLKEVGISNISIDLMYGLPNQSIEQFSQDLLFATTLDIKHVSIYSLTIEPNSVFGRTGVKQIDVDLEADMYEKAIEILVGNGFEQYEVSSFAKKGFESIHNLTYWQYEDFYGIGIGASGKEGNSRYTNIADFKSYLAGDCKKEIVQLALDDMMFETVMMGLRLKRGIDLVKFENKYNTDLREKYAPMIKKHVVNGNLLLTDSHLATTAKGLGILNEVLVDFLAG